MQIEIANNSNPGVCSACGGRCCNHRPGVTDITDWGKTRNEIETNIEKALRTGYWCSDPWDGDPTGNDDVDRVHMIRPSGRDHKGALYHAPFFESVPCAFLTYKGCFYSFRDRPLMCRTLIPNQESPGDCTAEDPELKRKMAIRWMPYNNFIQQLIRRLENEEPDSNGARPILANGNYQRE